MTPLDTPAPTAEERAAKAMWSLWGLSDSNGTAASWDREGVALKEMWRAYARVALAAAIEANAVEAERLRSIYATHLAWPVDKSPRNGAPSEEWAPFFAANRARKALLDAFPALLDGATLAAASAAGEREALGRLIDPDAWHATLPQDGCGAYWNGRRIAALEKADAILARQFPPAKLDAQA